MQYFCVTVTDRPQEVLLSRHVIDTICATGKQIDLGKQLLSEEYINDMDVMEANESNDAKDKCSKMFKIWLDTQHGASWKQLIEALHQIGLSNLADELNNKLLSNEPQDRASSINLQKIVIENIPVHPYPADNIINMKKLVLLNPWYL